MSEAAALSELPVSRILSSLLSRGGEHGELFFEEARSLTVLMEDGRIERVVSGTDAGIGVRLLFRGKTYYAYTNDRSAESLLGVSNDLSRYAEGDGVAVTLPASARSVRGPTVIRVPPAARGIDGKVALVREVDRIARGFSREVRQVRATWSESLRRIEVVAHPGVFVREEQTYCVLAVQIVAGDGAGLTMGYESAGGTEGMEFLGDGVPEELARKAAGRAVRALHAAKLPGGPMPVVLSSEAGGTMVHEAVGHGLEADLARRGMSVYKEKLGERVGSPLVSIVDDATLPGKRGSFGMDDEGTPGERTVLVDGGILKGFLHDRLSAMKDGVPPTGNGRRESYRHKPIPRMTNTLILPGSTPPEAILSGADRGLLVVKMGGGQVNTVTGDFMFEVAEGYRIEGGKRGEPVRGATITGNGPEVLSMIDRVGSDLGFGIGTCGKDGQGVPVGDAQPTLSIGPPFITVG
ncbi:TldD/PmbA family protein [Candidatus Deferrimicrobium sp.]|uniref:TldD/PmbA family protein n=1 Tax=Candidatus Deferrimicrobium sp. TaxID=3060586 RepID=UPI0027253682|nr:TldD/PmbA family protein [Candidatus Deferrimicrobium sp.]MDO8737645.1 TldD/PmbA family protein [Candidatus Deferrimicrobium sp.]